VGAVAGSTGGAAWRDRTTGRSRIVLVVRRAAMTKAETSHVGPAPHQPNIGAAVRAPTAAASDPAASPKALGRGSVDVGRGVGHGGLRAG
jgi:hypothetical protein